MVVEVVGDESEGVAWVVGKWSGEEVDEAPLAGGLGPAGAPLVASGEVEDATPLDVEVVRVSVSVLVGSDDLVKES